ncbi:MAG: hypothetical protein MI975_25280 [Cytophagales bacterium]|nr:hypothetical protein [Cytophagales bacterium]
MEKYILLRYIILVILVLPIFYSHFKFLPEAIKYALDLLLFLYFVNHKNFTRQHTPFSKRYIIYISLISLITLISIFIHGNSFTVFLQELRRLLYPLLFYYILRDVLKSDNRASVKLHNLFLVIFLIQIPVTVLQTVLFPVFEKMNVYIEGGSINIVDIASGTLGGGGTSVLGVLLPLILIYLYDLSIFKFGVLFFVPLLLINSGGGLVLFGLVFLWLVVYSFFTGPIKYRLRVLSGISASIVLIILLSSIEPIRERIGMYEKAFVRYNKVLIEEGRETWQIEDSAIKIDRLNGYKYLNRHMNIYNLEQLFGLGFNLKNESNKRKFSYKSDVNYIIAERGFVGLIIYFFFAVVVLRSIKNSLRSVGHQKIPVKLLLFTAFFIGGFYSPTSRSFQLWLMVMYFLALIENKNQYQMLIDYIKETGGTGANLRHTRS